MCNISSVNLISTSTLFEYKQKFGVLEKKLVPQFNKASSISEKGWTIELSHEIIVLFMLHKLFLQTRMRSHPKGLDVWFLVDPSSTSILYMCKHWKLWRDCAGSSEPSLVAYVISTIISCLRWHIWAPHDKTNKMVCAPSEDSDQPGHPPSLIRVFAVRMKKVWVLSYPLSAQWRLIRLGRCPGWSESPLGAHAILLVLSWGGSYY